MNRYRIGATSGFDDEATQVAPGEIVRHLDDASLVTVVWADLRDEQRSELLEAADAAEVPLAIIFDSLGIEEFEQVVIPHRSVWLPLDRSMIDGMPGLAPGTIPHRWSDAPEAAFRIGSLFALDGRDDPVSYPDRYEAQRSLSLVSAAVSSFVSDLRSVTSQMRRAPLRPSWNVWDEGPDLARQDRGGEWTLNPGPGMRPNLRDLFRVPSSAVTTKLLGTEPADPSWSVRPPRLLILGESGTGKTLVANLVHRLLWSDTDAHDPSSSLVSVNLGGREQENLDYELMGAAFGTFTGAWGPGLLARAARGTIFFDELGDLPIAAQARLLKYLDDLMVTPVGMQRFFGHTHVIAATNRDLDAMISAREFRHDLRARFALTVQLPSLRTRGASEIRRLVDFVAQNPAINPLRKGGEFTVTHIDPEALGDLVAEDYHDGNFRELEEVVGAALASAIAARRRCIERSDVAGRQAHHRSPDEARVVEIESIDVSAFARVVPVTRPSELHRLAALRGQVVLRDPAGRLYVADHQTLFVARP